MKNPIFVPILILAVGAFTTTAYAAGSLKKGGACSAEASIIQDSTEFFCPAISTTEKLTVSKIYQKGWRVASSFYSPDLVRINLIVEEQKNE